MRPDFLVIGSQKAGTSTLWAVLRAHPQVWMPAHKELSFFNDERAFGAGLGAYEAHFEAAPRRARRVGEASPGYVCHPAVPRRVYDALPGARLILTVRNPIDRAWSQYWDARRQLRVPFHFEEAVDRALETQWQPGRIGYFSRGVYLPAIEAWLAHFPRERLHIVVLEDLRRDPSTVWRALFRVLGIDEGFQTPVMSRRTNESAVFGHPIYRWFLEKPERTRLLPRGSRSLLLRGPLEPYNYPAMDPATRARLVDFYRPHNAALEAFLGRPLGWDR